MAKEKIQRRGIAPTPNAEQQNDIALKREAYLNLVASWVDGVREAFTDPTATPQAIETFKVRAITSIREQFPDAPEDFVRADLDKAVLNVDADQPPAGSETSQEEETDGDDAEGNGDENDDNDDADDPAAVKPPVVVKNDQVAGAPLAAKDPPVTDSEVMVMVNIPKAFKLRLDHHVVVEYSPGAQEIPESHANHWYAEANGVRKVKTAKKAEKQ